MIARRTLLKDGMTKLAGTICVPFINRGSYKLFAQTNTEYSERGIRLVKEPLVIDMLNLFKGTHPKNSGRSMSNNAVN
jgi:hypothetical protein